MEYLLLAQGAPQDPGGFFPIFLFIMTIFIFYFVAYRPIQKERKRHEEMVRNLKKNDKIITNGGIYGVITNVGDKEVTVRIDDSNNVKVKVLKSAIMAVVPKEKKEKDKEKQDK